MNNVQSLTRALNIALKKPAPNVIPLSGRDRLSKRDYFSVTFHDEADPTFLVDDLDGDLVHGRWVTSQTEPKPDAIPLVDLASTSFCVRQYYQELEFNFSSASKFLWHTKLRLPKFKLVRERILNALFSRKLRVRSDRISVLNRLVDNATEMGEGKSVGGLMNEIYGKRWSGNCAGTPAYLYTKLLLESLVESGEMKIENNIYGVKPKAISTIIEHEIEDRRHRDSVAQQRQLLYLTVILTFASVVQAYAALKKS